MAVEVQAVVPAAGVDAERPVGADAMQDWMAMEAGTVAEDDGEDWELVAAG
jgi:hypothetical protein